MNHARAWLAVAVLVAASAFGAAPAKLNCETWHPRIGQSEDKPVAIDFDARTCNGEPCLISDAELRWKEQNERYVFVVNRLSGEGSMSYQGEVLFLLKKCALAAGN
jgi:hypothetical protein